MENETTLSLINKVYQSLDFLLGKQGKLTPEQEELLDKFLVDNDITREKLMSTIDKFQQDNGEGEG